MAQLLIRPTDEMKESIQNKAKKMGLTVNALIIQILWEWIKKQEAN